ncbi:Auxin-responsive protein saur64 [Thalictrum thalictroides]|uniref:Auxin-responsive protein saur64 n=1 Tax=Thalictrum thalictroides TaxID=46969 RepID=A0A7J6VPJ6_THATH|nr:Auxin-responsive protein saur64 [Thalictrum thalictroides]
MINPMRFMEITTKLHKVTYSKRMGSSTKGYFVVYTTDKKRFVIPLQYLNNKIFKELFRMSEEQFGLPRNGPIILPCDGVFMEYIVSFLQRKTSDDLEKALLISMNNDIQRSSTTYLP